MLPPSATPHGQHHGSVNCLGSACMYEYQGLLGMTGIRFFDFLMRRSPSQYQEICVTPFFSG